MGRNSQNQTITDDIRHQGQGLLQGQGHTDQRGQKDIYVNKKDHQVRGPVPDLVLVQGQGHMRGKEGQGHISQGSQRNVILPLQILTLLFIDIIVMGTLENIPKVYVLMGNQIGSPFKRGLTAIER